MIKKIPENLMVLLLICFLGLGFWKGLERGLEDFFCWQITKTTKATYPIVYHKPVAFSLKPFRDWQVEEPELDARAAISAEISNGGISKKFLFKKNTDERRPIASLTKLMSACVVLENYDLSQSVTVSQEAADQEGEAGFLKPGEILSVEDLLYVMLMESSNDAAFALAEVVGEEKFVALMNSKSKEIGLENTYFFNPSGLDPQEPDINFNYSSVEDLVTLSQYLLDKPLLWEILGTQELNLYSFDGLYYHQLSNTNKLLGYFPGIIGGKTGWTDKSRGCFLVVLKTPGSSKYLINVILGAEDRLREMENMLSWVFEAYEW